MRDSLRSTI